MHEECLVLSASLLCKTDFGLLRDILCELIMWQQVSLTGILLCFLLLDKNLIYFLSLSNTLEFISQLKSQIVVYGYRLFAQKQDLHMWFDLIRFS